MPDNDQPITLIDLPDEILLHLAALPDHPERWESVARLTRTHPIFRSLFHASLTTWNMLYQQYFAHHHEMAYQKRGVYPSYKDLMKAREDHFFRRVEENSDGPFEPINYRTDSKKFSILSKWFSAAHLGDEKLFFEQMEALEQLEGVDFDRYQDQNGQTIWQFLYAGMPDVQWPERTGKANILKRIFEKLSPLVGKNEEKRIEMQLHCGQITRSDWDAFVKNREELITRANRSVVDLSEKKKADDKLNYFFTLAVKLRYASLARYFMASRNEEKLTDWSPLEAKLTPDGDSILGLFFEATKHGQLTAIATLFEMLPSLQRKKLFKSRRNGGNPAFLAAEIGRSDVIEKFLELASAEERQCLLKQKDSGGNTLLIVVAIYGRETVIEKIWELASIEERQRLLRQERGDMTAFLFAARMGNARAIAAFLKLASPDERRCFLEQKNDVGKSAFLIAAANGHAGVIVTLWDLASPEERQHLLNKRDNDNKTAFLLSAANGHANVIAILLERASAEERQQLLEQRDRLGNTAFLLAADPCGVREDVIAKFLELSSPKECLCLLKQRNNAGNTAFLLIYGHYNWGGASNAFAKLLESSLPIRKELILDYLLEGNQYDSRLTGCKFWFIYSLKRVLSAENPFQLQRADILNIVFPLLKEGLISKTGPFAFISEEQGASQFFGFFKRALNENEREKWHTRTYSLALGMLKDAYDALGNGVLDNTEEEKAFRSYVRGNNVFSLGQRATRGGMLRSTSFAR